MALKMADHYGRKVFLACALLAMALPAKAQQQTFDDLLLDRLVGQWVLKGTIAGQPTVHDVTAHWTLAHQYLEIHEVSREKDKGGQPAYQATVFIGWDGPMKRYACIWLDDYGGMSSQSMGHALQHDNVLAFEFQNVADSGKFHTVFGWDKAMQRWTMNMDNETDGKLKPFARTVLTRAP